MAKRIVVASAHAAGDAALLLRSRKSSSAVTNTSAIACVGWSRRLVATSCTRRDRRGVRHFSERTTRWANLRKPVVTPAGVDSSLHGGTL